MLKKCLFTLLLSNFITTVFAEAESYNELAHSPDVINKHEDSLIDQDGVLVTEKFLFAKELKLINNYIKPIAHIAKSKHMSKMIGWIQNNSTPLSINWKKFALKHSVNLDECVIPENGFQTFNEFFTRKLKADARPIDQTLQGIVSPADSKVTYVSDISKKDSFIIKNSKWSLAKMLNNELLAELYEGGTLISFRLSPEDYHRFHFPIDCTPGFSRKIAGKYDSVNPFVFKHGYDPLGENARSILILKSEEFQDPICIIVGALGVGKIIETYTPDILYRKGDEMGYFEFGASTVCLLFKKNVIKPAHEKFEKNSQKSIETQIKQGSLIAIHQLSTRNEPANDNSFILTIKNYTHQQLNKLRSFFNY
jgi:phosphatidylserine decarboxylase